MIARRPVFSGTLLECCKACYGLLLPLFVHSVKVVEKQHLVRTLLRNISCVIAVPAAAAARVLLVYCYKSLHHFLQVPSPYMHAHKVVPGPNSMCTCGPGLQSGQLKPCIWADCFSAQPFNQHRFTLSNEGMISLWRMQGQQFALPNSRQCGSEDDDQHIIIPGQPDV